MSQTKTWVVDKAATIEVNAGVNYGAGAGTSLYTSKSGANEDRSLVSAPEDWAGVGKIVKVELWGKVSNFYNFGYHGVKGRQITAAWSEGTSVGMSTSNAVKWPGPADTATGETGQTVVSYPAGTWGVIVDCTAIFEAIAPTTVLKRDGTPGGAQTWLGIKLIPWADSSTATIYSDDSAGNQPYFLITYDQFPNAPTLQYPIGGVRIGPQSPTFQYAHSHPGGKNSAQGRIQIDDDPAFGSPASDNTIAAVVANGATINHTPAGFVGTRGVTYYWRAMTQDSDGLWGPWSAGGSFKVDNAPTVTKVRPLASQFAYIWNLNDLAVWTSGGAHAQPQMEWTFSDADGGAQSAYQVRIYDASSGGTMVYSSGKVPGSWAALGTGLAIVAGTERWWTIEVWDDVDVSSGESSRTAFKVRWAQAIYEHNPGSGSSSWLFSAAPVTAGVATFAFAGATGASGAGRGSWVSSLGSITPVAWINVLVRLQPLAAPGTTPQLPDMTFTYLGAATTPDRWQAVAQTIVLDPSIRRHGSQSLKVVSGNTDSFQRVYPYRKVNGDDIPVQPSTTYMLSAWVKTGAPITGGELHLFVYRQGGAGDSIAHGIVADGGATTDTSSYPEGWQRLVLGFQTPGDTSIIQVGVRYTGTTASQNYWLDGFKLEEGTVATPWSPGMVGDPVVMDAGGIAIDAFAGGIFRARGSSGGARDQIELGPHGWLFTDVEFWSPAAEVLQIGDGLNGQTLIVEGGTSNSPSKIKLRGPGNGNPNAGAEAIYGSIDFNLSGDAYPLARVAAVQPNARYLDSADLILSTGHGGPLTERLRIFGNSGVVSGQLATLHNNGTVSDASFPTPPPNGTFAVDYGGNKIWVRLNGVWKSVAVA